MEITLATWGPARADIKPVLAQHGLHQDGIFLTGNAIPAGIAIETAYLGTPSHGVYIQFFGISEVTNSLAQLVFDLADTAGAIITVDPGPPHIVITPRGPTPEEVTDDTLPPGWEVVVGVDKPTSLQKVLNDD